MQTKTELLCSASCCCSCSCSRLPSSYHLPPGVPLTINSKLPDVASLSQSLIIQLSHLLFLVLSRSRSPTRAPLSVSFSLSLRPPCQTRRPAMASLSKALLPARSPCELIYSTRRRSEGGGGGDRRQGMTWTWTEASKGP